MQWHSAAFPPCSTLLFCERFWTDNIYHNLHVICLAYPHTIHQSRDAAPLLLFCYLCSRFCRHKSEKDRCRPFTIKKMTKHLNRIVIYRIIIVSSQHHRLTTALAESNRLIPIIMQAGNLNLMIQNCHPFRNVFHYRLVIGTLRWRKQRNSFWKSSPKNRLYRAELFVFD